MLDVIMHSFSGQAVLQIQYRKYIFVFQLALFVFDIRKCRIAAFFQKPAVYLVDVLCYIHLIEFLLYDQELFFRKITSK